MILVYCLYGGRSSIACEILALDQNIGPFKIIYNMIGGTTEWANPLWNYTLVVTPPLTYTTINATVAHLMVTSGSATYGKCNLIVDVRSQTEYDAQHIVNSTIPPILHAINNYWDNEAGFESRIAPLIGHEDDPIIVYCVDNTCSKSTLACQYLVDHNFRKVYKLDDGIYAWKHAGYPTAPTPPSPGLFSDGFETGLVPPWTGTSTTSGETLEVVSTPFFEGLYSCRAKCITAKHQAYAFKTFSSANDTLYMRAYVRFATDLIDGNSGVAIMDMTDSSNNIVFRLRIRKTSGLYRLEVACASGISYDSTKSAPFSITTGEWYAVEFQAHIDTSSGWFKVLWEGGEKIYQTGKNTGTTMLQRVNVGIDYNWGSNAEIYVDSVTVSNDPISP
jgi:rhodanese-related sulfurtransferase